MVCNDFIMCFNNLIKTSNFMLHVKERNVSSDDVSNMFFLKTNKKKHRLCINFLIEGKSVCVFCWDDSWFSLVFRYQPVDIIQPTNHVLPASFGDSDWHIVTGNSVTTTNESPRRKPSQHELEKQRMPGDYFLSSLPCCEDWLGARAFFFLCPPLPSPRPFFLFFFLVFLALLSCRAWPPEAGAEQPLPGSEFRAGPGAVRLSAGPRVAPEGRVSPTPAHAPAPTHPPAHLHALPRQSAPGRHPHPAHRTPHGAYPSQKCEDK